MKRGVQQRTHGVDNRHYQADKRGNTKDKLPPPLIGAQPINRSYHSH